VETAQKLEEGFKCVQAAITPAAFMTLLVPASLAYTCMSVSDGVMASCCAWQGAVASWLRS
jgi:hypothetical protein